MSKVSILSAVNGEQRKYNKISAYMSIWKTKYKSHIKYNVVRKCLGCLRCFLWSTWSLSVDGPYSPIQFQVTGEFVAEFDFLLRMITTHCRSRHQLEGSHFCEQRPYMKWTLKFRVLIQRFVQMVMTLSYLVHYNFNRHEIQNVCCTRYDKKLEYVHTVHIPYVW